MPTVKVRTSQNVMIEYPVATVVDRLLAFLIDALIMLAYAFMVLYGFSSIIDDVPIAFFLTLIIPVLFYHLLSEIFMNGQSVGKRQMKIRVVRLDGSRPSIGSYLLRWILRPIDNGFYGAIAIVSILVSPNGQRLGDMAAGTTVIKLKRPSKGLATNPVEQNFDDDYKVVYSEVIRLSDEEIDLIDKALDYYRQQANPGPANLLAEKLAEKMGVKLDIAPITFLYTVKKDYYHITSQ